MAEEVSGGMTGPNGERLELRIGSKSLGLQVKDILPLLLLLGGIIGGYLIFISVEKELTRLQVGQDKIMDYMYSVTNEPVVQKLLEGQSATKERLREQDEQLHEQTQLLQEALQRQTNEIKRLFSVMQYNIDRPIEQRIPLEVDPRVLEQHRQ